MASVNSKECRKAGLDVDVVLALARRFEHLARDAGNLGIDIFCGSSCSLRFCDGDPRALIVANFYAHNADGGAGDACEDEEGFIRGE